MLVNIFRPTYSGDRPSGQIVNPLKKPASYQSTNLKSSNTQIYKKMSSKGPVGLSIQKLGPPPGSISSNTVLDQRLTNNRKRPGSSLVSNNSTKISKSSNVLASGEM